MFLFTDSITSCLIACFYLCYGSSRSNSQTGSFHSSIHHGTPAGQIIQWHPSFPSQRSSDPSCGLPDLHGGHPVSTALLTLLSVLLRGHPNARRYICLQMSSRSEEGTGVTGNRRVRTTWCRCWRLRASIRALRTPQSLLYMHPLVYELALYSPTPHACPSPCPAFSSTGHVSHTMKWLKF